jgi:medium-chain acyl-[acyl-carrier-protein] hydrolase
MRPKAEGLERWLPHRRRQARATVNLLCFPYAGGGASAYRDWQSAWPERIEVCSLELPGRETRFSDPLRTDLSALATEIAELIEPLWERPLAFFGHSMGALVAFETARIAGSRGHSLQLLCVSGARAPSVPRRTPLLHALPDAEFVAQLSELGGTPSEVLAEPELLELIVPILRADCGLIERHVSKPGSTLACPILALGGSDDPHVTLEELAAWRTETSSTYREHVFAGNHFFLHASKNEVLGVLGSALLTPS